MNKKEFYEKMGLVVILVSLNIITTVVMIKLLMEEELKGELFGSIFLVCMFVIGLIMYVFPDSFVGDKK